MDPRGPLPTGVKYLRIRVHRSSRLRLYRDTRLLVRLTHPLQVSPHLGLPRPPSTLLPPFAKTPLTLTLNPDSSSPLPSLDASRPPRHHCNRSLNKLNNSHSSSSRNPQTTFSHLTFTPLSQNRPRHHNYLQKTSNKTSSRSFLHPPSPSSPRTHLASLPQPSRPGTRLVGFRPMRTLLHRVRRIFKHSNLQSA